METFRVGRGFVLFAFSLLSGLLGCEARGSHSDVVRADSAGIEVVESFGEDMELEWTFQRRFGLGGKESGPESFFSVGPLTVGADGSGRIHVMNSNESHVAIFSSEGEFIRIVGAHGEGPGEISLAGSLAVSPAGTVSIFDFARGVLVQFGPEGNFLRNFPFRFFPWAGAKKHVAETADGFLVATMASPLEENTSRHALQFIAENDTTVVADRSFPDPGMVIFESCRGGLNLPRVFEAEISWGVYENRIAVSRTDHYELEIFEGSRLVRKIRRALGVRPATEQMAMEELGEGLTVNFGSGPCLIEPRELLDGRGFAETVPWVLQVALAPGGEMWVGRKDVGETDPAAIDIFDETGAYQGTLPPGTPFPLVFLNDNLFGAAEIDAVDIGRLVVYEILR